MRRLLTSFRHDERGNFAVIAALTLVPVIGLAGLGLDFSRAYSVRTTLQGEGDAIAMAVASEGPEAASSRYADAMRSAAIARVNLADARFEGRWITAQDYEVVSYADMPLTLSRIIPANDGALAISTRSIARYMGARYVYKQPELTQLDPEAGDYNRIYAYCFDPLKGAATKSAGRGKMARIADNGGTKDVDPIPQCAAGENLSFRLHNVRNSRTNRANWDNPARENYQYYTDTVRSAQGQETHHLDGFEILETVLCPSLARCVGVSKGGVIPEGKGRTPQRTTQKCEPGKFMYYGWEDRPPGRGTTDRDYDDIRIIIECPKMEQVGIESVQLVK